jgi:hypothetical protein
MRWRFGFTTTLCENEFEARDARAGAKASRSHAPPVGGVGSNEGRRGL